MTGGVRILCVCTHNRTRSVLMGALLAARAEQAGLRLDVRTGGFKEAGQPPTRGTTDLLARHGIDATGHRSTAVTVESATAANLVLTAEQEHVISVAALGRGLFERTFTLPQFVTLARRHGPIGETALADWLATVNEDRPRGIDYLSADVDEIADPTGGSPREWSVCYDRISGLVDATVLLLG